MRKVNFKAALGQSLIVCGILLLGFSQMGKLNDASYLDSSYALVRPMYEDTFIMEGRLSVRLDSVTTISQVTGSANKNAVYYFIFFTLAVLFLNNSLISYQVVQDKEGKRDEASDDVSFKRLHAYLSHEQKNNLAIIRSRMEIAKDYETLAYIDKISNSMDDVLTLSDNVVIEDLEVVDMSLLIAEVCDDYRPLAQIKYNFDESDNHILSKYQWIYRAMSNLLDNAIKFSDGKNIEINVETKNNTVVVSVKDTGIGIPVSEMEKIFHHEYRIDNLKSDGYGIGLSLVNRVCDLSGGVIWVESEVDEGTTFYLCFPELTLD